MNTANQNPLPRIEVPWNIHFYVWTFMIAFSVSPALCVLGSKETVQASDVLAAITSVVLIQNVLWIAQQRCSRDELTYWDGLLVAAAAMRTGFAPLSLVLSSGMLLITVGASIVYALTHDGTTAARHASIRFSRLIIAIWKGRLWR